ncbi:MAG: PH domain-containing protein [Jatrophihabitans sp.]|uniref:PH domain-containing protein n=1 Tax=Jatrophihabitans sp. TaxID=1932789 RepID=UPI003F7D74BF
MTSPAPTPVAETGALASVWARLHPLSPVVQFGRAFGVLLIVIVPRVVTERQLTSTLIELGILVLGSIGGAVHWAVTRWRVHGGELQIETGLLRRQSIRLPLANIQSVDVVRPGLGRLAGLSEVRVESAGTGTSHGRLAYLREDRATEVRAQLLALAHGLHEATPEPPELPLWQVRGGRLLASALLGGPALVVMAFVVLLVALFASGATKVAFGVLGGFLAVAVTFASLVVRRIVAEFAFRIAAAGDGLRLHSGLVETRAETIPFGRVQALRCTQPLLWRPFGWLRVEVDLARQRAGRRGSEADSRLLSRALMPVGHASDVGFVASRVLRGADVLRPGSRPPRRALVRAPLSWWASSVWHDGAFVVARTGRLELRTTVVPLDKVQSVRWTQGPLQRALRLATVHVDVAGRGWHAQARHRDVDESRQLLAELSSLAAHARRDRRGQWHDQLRPEGPP